MTTPVSAADEAAIEPDADDIEILPWWRSPLNLAALGVAVLVLGLGLGYWWADRSTSANPNDVDIGFLQDMRTHHEQAVNMSMIYLAAARGGGDPVLQNIAREIATGQSMEIGRMVQLLRVWGEDEANMTDQAMAWMDEPVPLDRMPGLASEDDLQTLARSTGVDADLTFIRLMTAHHEGGIHMAERAMADAKEEEVRLMAESMVRAQTGDLFELGEIETRLGAAS